MLKIGVSVPPRPPVQLIVELARNMDEKGYDSLWFPDHLMGWFPPSLWTPEIIGNELAQNSPDAFFETTLSIALAASSTTRIRLGSSVTESLRHHPAMLAQSYATLEHMTNSRVILGLGAGELVNTQPYGLRYEKTVSRLEEAVQVIKLLWGSRTNELINYNGKFFKLENAIFGLPALQHRPQIWIGGNGERMCRITADHADGWLPYYLTTEEYKDKLKIVRDECSRIGRDFEQIEKAIILRLIIDTSREECSRIMETPLVKALALDFPADLYRNLGYRHPLGEDFHSLTDYIPSKYTRDEITHAIEQIPSEVVKQSYVWGNIEDVVDKLDEYRKAGVQTVVLFNCTFLGDFTKLLSSYSCIDELVSNFKEK